MSTIFRLPGLSPQKETQDRSNCDNGSQYADLVPVRTYDGADYIGGDEYFEAEEEVCPELLSDGLILADLARDSRSNPLYVAMKKEWRAIPDETGHFREEALSFP